MKIMEQLQKELDELLKIVKHIPPNSIETVGGKDNYMLLIKISVIFNPMKSHHTI